jgi:hypothetical protein
MPGGSEISGDVRRMGCRLRQRAYHYSYPVSHPVGGTVSSSQMSQPALDSIAGDGVPDGSTNHKANACPVVQLCSVNYQGGPTHAYATPGRGLEVLRAAHSQRSRQHVGRSTKTQADRRARPLRRRAEIMARPARVRIRRRKPWVRLRRRLLGWNVRLLTGKLPHLRSAR